MVTVDRIVLNVQRVVAVMAIAAAITMQVLANGLAFVQEKKTAPSGLKAPILVMELPQSSKDVASAVGPLKSADRETMRKIQYIDYVFIMDYALLFAGFAWLMFRNNRRLAIPAAVALLCSTGGAIFDYREDQGILQLLDAPLPADPRPGDELQPMVDATRGAAQIKWDLLFVALMLLSILFFDLGRWMIAVGALYLAAGAIGVAGVWQPHAMELASPLLAAGLLTVTAVLLFRPRLLLK